MAPWADGIAEVAQDTCGVTGDEWLYVLSYELIVPLRNAVMFDPATVTTDADEWAKLSKVYVDCDIKSENEGDGQYSTDEVYAIL